MGYLQENLKTEKQRIKEQGTLIYGLGVANTALFGKRVLKSEKPLTLEGLKERLKEEEDYQSLPDEVLTDVVKTKVLPILKKVIESDNSYLFVLYDEERGIFSSEDSTFAFPQRLASFIGSKFMVNVFPLILGILGSTSIVTLLLRHSFPADLGFFVSISLFLFLFSWYIALSISVSHFEKHYPVSQKWRVFAETGKKGLLLL